MWRAIGASSHIADIWHRRFHRSHVSPAKTRSVAAITALASPSPSKEYARNSLVSIFRKALLLTISDRKILFTSSPTRVFLRYKLFNYLSRSRFLEKWFIYYYYIIYYRGSNLEFRWSMVLFSELAGSMFQWNVSNVLWYINVSRRRLVGVTLACIFFPHPLPPHRSIIESSAESYR